MASTHRCLEEFDWQMIMELGKDPGLNLRTLHEQGITGRGWGSPSSINP